MIDQIAFRYYGSNGGTAEAIFSANQDLSREDIVLAAGTPIALPRIDKKPAFPSQIRLWD